MMEMTVSECSRGSPDEAPQTETVRKRASKASKQVAKLYAKQQQRKVKTGALPDPESGVSIEDYTSFAKHLHASTRILSLCGAGLSAASGIPTFRGAGGFWRQHNATDLSTPEAFEANPVLVWRFFLERRHAALKAQPNRAHYALAKLGQHKPGFLAISQNIDGLSERAGHGETTLQRVHGSLHQIKCSSKACTYRRDLAPTEQIVPAIERELEPAEAADREPATAADLPRCPQCGSFLRPAVVWFGEPLEMAHVERIRGWFDAAAKVDLMLVVGTSALVFPAAAYIHAARVQGARIAVFDVEPPSDEAQENPITRLRDGIDWFFQGSAADVLPDVLKEVVGTIKLPIS